MKIRGFILIFIMVCMQLTSCAQRKKTDVTNVNGVTTETGTETEDETEIEDEVEDETEMEDEVEDKTEIEDEIEDEIETDNDGDIKNDTLAALTGYYSRMADLPEDGRININFFIYQEENHYYGYMNMIRHERIEGQQYPEDFQVRLLAEIRKEQDAIKAVCLEDFSDLNHKDHFGTYEEGELLFSLSLEGEELQISWERFFMNGLEDMNLFPDEKCLSIELINQRDVEIFLRARGVEGKKIFAYQEDESGSGDYLEVFYDVVKEKGAGVYYIQYEDGFKFYSGFDIASCGHDEWEDHRFDVIHDGVDLLEEYDFETEYNENGQIEKLETRGEITGWGHEPYEDTIALAEYYYREDGTLERKDCYFNYRVFGTTESSQTFYYDGRERLIEIYSYITHGCLRTFYIYEGDCLEPEYCLELDFFGTSACADSFIRYDGKRS